MKSVLLRTNFEGADLSDALMDRAVIVQANLKDAVLQVGHCSVLPGMAVLPQPCLFPLLSRCVGTAQQALLDSNA